MPISCYTLKRQYLFLKIYKIEAKEYFFKETFLRHND